MAKYDKETKFYWLQLKEDFFDDDAIEWLEEQENGHKYSLFYLKLCLKSLKSNGVLIRKVGNMLVPYDNKKLADLTKTPIDTVIVAMELLKGIGLVKVLEGGELYITQLENMIGSASKGALKKQQQRALKKQQEQLLLEDSGQEEDNCPPKIEIESKDKNKTKDKVKHIFGEYKNVRLTDEELQSLRSSYGDDGTNELITYLDEYIEMKGYKAKSHYLCIKKWVIKAVKEKKGTRQPVREEKVPEWFGKEIKEEAMSEEDIAEMEALKRELQENYG